MRGGRVGGGVWGGLGGSSWKGLDSSTLNPPTDSNLFYSLGKQKEAFLLPFRFSWFLLLWTRRPTGLIVEPKAPPPAPWAPPSPIIPPGSTLHYISAAWYAHVTSTFSCHKNTASCQRRWSEGVPVRQEQVRFLSPPILLLAVLSPHVVLYVVPPRVSIAIYASLHLNDNKWQQLVMPCDQSSPPKGSVESCTKSNWYF